MTLLQKGLKIFKLFSSEEEAQNFYKPKFELKHYLYIAGFVSILGLIGTGGWLYLKERTSEKMAPPFPSLSPVISEKKEQEIELSDQKLSLGSEELGGTSSEIERSEKNSIQIEEESDILEEAQMYLEAKKPDYALQLYKKYLKLHPGNLKALFNLGTLYQKRGDFLNARLCYEKILQKDPNHHNTLINLLPLLTKHEFLNLVLRLELLLETLSPLDASTLAGQISFVHAHHKNFDQALFFIQKAIHLNPGDPFLYFNLAIFYEEKGEKELAKGSYEKTLALQKMHPLLNFPLDVIEKRLNFLRA